MHPNSLGSGTRIRIGVLILAFTCNPNSPNPLCVMSLQISSSQPQRLNSI